MLLRAAELERIARGEITLAFRRWRRPTVRAGGTLRTPMGVLEIVALEETSERAITEAQARRAGHPSRAALLEQLARRPEGTLWRIELRPGGPDPRVRLRGRRPGGARRGELVARLDAMDRRSKGSAWTRRVLAAIRAHPGRRAAELARELGLETLDLKRRVRRLKELGLTVSLETGYRLSPRGRVVLGVAERSASPRRSAAGRGRRKA